MPARMKFSDEIRAAVKASGLTQAEICQRAGISPAALCRFLAGQSGLQLSPTLDDLAVVLRLHAVARKSRGRPRKERE